MSAHEHLSPQQFMPIEDMHNLHSNDHEVPMHKVRQALNYDWTHADEHDLNPGDLAHDGPDNYVSHLAKDIAKNGMRDPITIKSGSVTDGHHRYLAAVEAGIKQVPVVHRQWEDGDW